MEFNFVDSQYLFGSPPLKYLSPTIIGKDAVILKVSNSLARPTWRLAGWGKVILQEYSFPGAGILVSQSSLSLNQASLIKLPSRDKSCIVEIDFPRWFDRAEVLLWGATWNTSEATLEQQQIEQQLDINTEQIDELTQEIQGLINSFEL